MSQMLKSSGAMGAATLTSRVLGLVREQVYAGFMGTSVVADAFIMAFSIPNLFRRLLGEGVLSAAFIPLFKAKEKTEGEVEMWRAANAVISGLIMVCCILVAVVMIGISVTLAFGNWSADTRLMLELLRFMFPYLILVCLAAVFIGMLNARGHFFIPAIGASVLNVVMIASVLWLAPHMGKTLDTKIFGLAIGVLVAGVAQAGFQLPTLHKEGFKFQWISPWRNETVREVVKKMCIGSIGVAAFQINVLLTQLFAFGAHASIVSTFNYSVRLMELPQGVFGISLATYLLPTLSGLAAEKKYPEFRSTLSQGLSYLVFLNLLASILLMVLAEPIIRLLFERGNFTSYSTHQVSLSLVCLAPGLIFFSVTNILVRAFYSLGDVTFPMKISIFCLVLNLILTAGLLFGFDLGARSLGLANTTTSGLNVVLLAFALRKKLKTLDMAEFRRHLRPVLVAGLVAGLLAFAAQFLWGEHLGHANLLLKLGHVFVPAGIAAVAYFGIALWLKVPSARDMAGLAQSRFIKTT